MYDPDELTPTISPSVRLAMLKRRRAIRTAKRIAGALTLVVAFLVVRAITAPDPSILDEVPPSILGRWVTDDERYRDREFIILEEEFRLRVGSAPEDVRAFPLREIYHFGEEAGTRFEIVYASADGDSSHEMTLLADGTVRLRNPPEVVWRRR